MKATEATQVNVVVARQRLWAKLSQYFAAPLALITPFVIFVTYHEYRFLSAEVSWGQVVGGGPILAVEVGFLCRSADTGHHIPLRERPPTKQAMMRGTKEMTADPKQILDEAMDRRETLEMGGRLEPAHLALALTSRLMRDLRSIVFVLPRTMNDGSTGR